MDCETLRRRLTENPARGDVEYDRHAESCAACTAYRVRLLRAETLIHAALRFDVGTARTDSRHARNERFPWALTSGIAAGLVIGVTLWGLFTTAKLTPEALAVEVAQHWYHEPDSWVESQDPVSNELLTRVLDGEVVLDRTGMRTVSYARTCWVAGERIPHLVVQGEAGPYMVLLMPGRVLESPVLLELGDEGLSGHIIPAGRGSVAVLGGGQAEEIERIEAAVIAAVDWTI